MESDSEGKRATQLDMVATLKAKKESLEAKLQERIQELKSICIKEAELTGVMPPEIPLEPGESPPAFRRRVGTAFAYPENLINTNKLPKSKEEQSLDALELEYNIQADITDAALKLANDTTVSKAIRRKRRQVYQQAQQRLLEIATKLTELRQTRGSDNKSHQLKQRKKPRPPLDSGDGSEHRDAMLQETGISLSPLSQELDTHSREHNMVHSETLPAMMRYTGMYGGRSRPIHPQIQRHAVGGYYSHPQQYHHQYSTLASCAHSELERIGQRERLDQGHTLPGYWLRYETSEVESMWYANSAPRPMYTQQPEDVIENRDMEPLLRHRSAGSARWHWEQDRFGSLDRRKAPSSSHSSSSPCLEGYGVDDAESPVIPNCYPTHLPQNPVATAYTQYYPQTHNAGVGGAILPSQTYPEHSLGMDNRLIRTQSLGSMETSQVASNSSDTRSVKDLQSHQHPSGPSENIGRKQKEKEWYETSLDAAPTPVSSNYHQRSRPPSRRPSGHSLSEMKLSSFNSDTSLQKEAHTPEMCINDRSSDVSSNLSRSSSNVSSEQRPHYLPIPSKGQEVTVTENFDTVVPFESPKNHMVVQAGKWQPYREVTKPFEMADFYKYSTKFRKANVANKAPSPLAYHLPPHLPPVGSPTPQQKGIYQPLQPMTCQPIEPTAPASPSNRSCLVSPNSSSDNVITSGESVADNFSNEMLAWYQDQSLPRSATLV